VSAAQSTQLAATALECVPAAQSMQAATPSLGVYLPDTQPLHWPFTPDQPALHKQYVMLAGRDTEEDEFGGHRVHLVLSSVENSASAQSLHVFMDPNKENEDCRAAQCMHSPVPTLCLYLPATQLAQSPITPDQPVLLPGHARQNVDAASESEYSPTAQAVHAIGPLWALNLPDAQPVRLSCVPVQPALHLHSVVVFGEKEFAEHCIHLVLPMFAFVLPAAHVTHSLPFMLSHPALQAQSVMFVLRAGEVEFAGHSAHHVLLAGQFVHGFGSA